MKKKSLNSVKILIVLFFIISVIFPLMKMFTYIGEVDVKKLILSEQFLRALKNSLTTAIIATIISILISLILAWGIMRTNIKYKGLFSIILTLPMLIPSISHGMGLIVLFGKNGVITNMLNLNWNIYGYWGIVIGSVLYAFPISFLMISDILRYEDSTPYEAASILGFSKWDKFKSITIPYIRKPMISVIFANFTMIVTDYGVPLAVGGKITTLPVVIYQEVIGLLNFNKGGVIGLILLLPAFIAFIIDLFNKDKGNIGFVAKEFDIKENKVRDILCYCFISCVILFVSLPIFAFIILTFVTHYPNNMSPTLNYIINTVKMGGSRYLINSLIISISVSIIGTIIAYITGYFTVRLPSNLSKILHLISITSLAVPGLVLGLAYVITFNKYTIYGSIWILILVNLVHFFASPYLMIYNSLSKINDNLEAIGMTLGISRLRMIKDVFIPQTIGTILEMISYFFVNSMITISAVSFLANVKTKSLSLLINQFEGNMMLEASAFVSLVILIINITMKYMVYFVKRLIGIGGHNK